MSVTAFRPVACALCLGDESVELYPATVTDDDFNVGTFSARRRPDRLHYRIVRCQGCGLVRSDPVADPELVASLYRASTFAYGEEIPNLVRTYGRQLARVARRRLPPSALLEIGCGNGFMLAEAQRQGFSSVSGIEPSRDAMEQADPSVRSAITCDVLRPGIVAPASFDVVCLFQVLDHMPDPEGTLDLCRQALKPGGVMLIFNHNVKAVSATVLRDRSPIIDVEHTFLFDRRTLSALCRSRGFEVEQARPAWNWCSVGYLARLLPLPEILKETALRALRRARLADVSVFLPLGNLCVVARKPMAATGR